jgi:hypothetical protein
MMWTFGAAIAASLGACTLDTAPSTVGPSDIPAAVWNLDSVPWLTIGQVDGTNPVYSLHRVGDVWLLEDERLALVSNARTIQMFGPSGQFEHAFGREGEGPTEFSNLHRLLKEGDSIFLALEIGRPRISRWRLNGDLVSEYRYDVGAGSQLESRSGFAVPSRAHVMAIHSPSFARLTELVQRQGRTYGQRKVVVSSALIVFGEERLDTLAIAPGRTWFYVEQQRGFDGSLLYSRPKTGPWGHGGAFTSGDNGIVEFYDARNNLAARVETARAGVPITRAVLDAWHEEIAEILGGLGASPRPDRPQFPVPERLPVYDRILQDGNECVWLERYRVPGSTTQDVDVVHPTRGLVATLTVPPNTRLRDVRGDRVAVLTTDELGVQRVQVLRLHRTGEPVCPIKE